MRFRLQSLSDGGATNLLLGLLLLAAPGRAFSTRPGDTVVRRWWPHSAPSSVILLGVRHDGWAGSAWCTRRRAARTAQAVDCYRRLVAFLDANPDYFEPAFKDAFVELIAKLAPPAAT
jgi:hypothetical protein